MSEFAFSDLLPIHPTIDAEADPTPYRLLTTAGSGPSRRPGASSWR